MKVSSVKLNAGVIEKLKLPQIGTILWLDGSSTEGDMIFMIRITAIAPSIVVRHGDIERTIRTSSTWTTARVLLGEMVFDHALPHQPADWRSYPCHQQVPAQFPTVVIYDVDRPFFQPSARLWYERGTNVDALRREVIAMLRVKEGEVA